MNNFRPDKLYDWISAAALDERMAAGTALGAL